MVLTLLQLSINPAAGNGEMDCWSLGLIRITCASTSSGSRRPSTPQWIVLTLSFFLIFASLCNSKSEWRGMDGCWSGAGEQNELSEAR